MCHWQTSRRSSPADRRKSGTGLFHHHDQFAVFGVDNDLPHPGYERHCWTGLQTGPTSSRRAANRSVYAPACGRGAFRAKPLYPPRAAKRGPDQTAKRTQAAGVQIQNSFDFCAKATFSVAIQGISSVHQRTFSPRLPAPLARTHADHHSAAPVKKTIAIRPDS